MAFHEIQIVHTNLRLEHGVGYLNKKLPLLAADLNLLRPRFITQSNIDTVRLVAEPVMVRKQNVYVNVEYDRITDVIDLGLIYFYVFDCLHSGVLRVLSALKNCKKWNYRLKVRHFGTDDGGRVGYEPGIILKAYVSYYRYFKWNDPQIATPYNCDKYALSGTDSELTQLRSYKNMIAGLTGRSRGREHGRSRTVTWSLLDMTWWNLERSVNYAMREEAIIATYVDASVTGFTPAAVARDLDGAFATPMTPQWCLLDWIDHEYFVRQFESANTEITCVVDLPGAESGSVSHRFNAERLTCFLPATIRYVSLGTSSFGIMSVAAAAALDYNYALHTGYDAVRSARTMIFL